MGNIVTVLFLLRSSRTFPKYYLGISNDFFRFASCFRLSWLICFNTKKQPMKTILRLYKKSPLLALILNSIAVFIWAATIIFIMTIMAVAFTG